MTTVVCWNMAYRREAWRELVRMEADIALLQEPCKTPDKVADQVKSGPPDDDAWDTPTASCRFPSFGPPSQTGIHRTAEAARGQ